MSGAYVRPVTSTQFGHPLARSRSRAFRPTSTIGESDMTQGTWVTADASCPETSNERLLGRLYQSDLADPTRARATTSTPAITNERATRSLSRRAPTAVAAVATHSAAAGVR